jgi:hypothetical protein
MALVNGCNTKYNDPVLDNFKRTQKLKHFPSRIESDSIGAIIDLLIMDSVLVTNNMYEEFVYRLYNINTRQPIINCVKKGRGPFEVLQPNLLNRDSNTIFSTFDVNSRSLIFYTISDLINGILGSIKVVRLDYNIFRAIPINDSLVLCTGAFENGEFILINMNSKNIISTLNYPKSKEFESISDFTRGFVLQGELALRPNNVEFVKVAGSAGIIEIGKIVNGKMKRVISEEYYYPTFKLNGKFPVYAKETKFAFHSLIATEDHFYVIYSGNSIADKGKEFTSGEHILIYDWELNPIIHCKLDRELKRMSINIERNIAYGYSINSISGEPEIVCYELPNL